MSIDADVIVLAAGFGTRLRPLTDSVPKPLLPVGDKSLLEIHLRRLEADGFHRVFVNAHYKREQIKEFLKSFSSKLEITLVEEEQKILGTGGAVRNIEPYLKSNYVCVINSDSLFGADFSFREALKVHEEKHPVATMILRSDPDVEGWGAIGVSQDGRVVSFRGEHIISSEPVAAYYMFSGASVLSRGIFEYMQPRGEEFCLARSTFKNVLLSGGVIGSFLYNGYWNDVGTFEKLSLAREDWALGKVGS